MNDIHRAAYAIPTWNRARPVERAVRSALQPPHGVAPVDVIVRDDGSTDDSPLVLGSMTAELVGCEARLHVTRAEVNGGYGDAVLRLLRTAATRAGVVILCADDDLPLPAGVPDVLAALERHGADMLSTPVPRDGRPGLDRVPPRVRRATPPELRAVAAHAPGIVLRTASLDGPLELLEQRLALGCDFARAYPQAVVAAHLLVHGHVRWSSTAVVATGLDLPTGIQGAGGAVYTDSGARWRQWISLQDLLEAEIRRSRGMARDRWHAIRAAEDVQLLPHLRAGLARTPEEARRFDRAGRRTYRDGAIRRSLRWSRSLARAPERAYLMARAVDLARRLVGRSGRAT